MKKNLPLEWNEDDKSKVINTGEYTLFVTKSESGWVKDIGKAEVIEGVKEDGKIRMVDFEDYCYCVLKG